MPAVSVIIPNYNHATFLKQRIDSVLQQTYQDFELILLDDLSTDSSKAVLEQYRNHPKVSHLHFNEKNSGSTFKQWNRGVALAKGDIIWIAESDDYADPQFLATLVQVLEKEPAVGLVYANSFFIDSSNTILRTYAEEYASWSDRWQNDFVNDGNNEVVHYLRYATVILNVSSCIFRKHIFEKVGGANEAFTLAGDWLTYVKMLQHANIAYCAQPLNYFRTHAQTVRNSSKQFVHFTEKLKVLQYVYEHFPVSAVQRKAQLYTILEEFVNLRIHLSLNQRKSVLRYLRSNFTYTIDLMLWKYRVSMLLKK